VQSGHAEACSTKGLPQRLPTPCLAKPPGNPSAWPIAADNPDNNPEGAQQPTREKIDPTSLRGRRLHLIRCADTSGSHRSTLLEYGTNELPTKRPSVAGSSSDSPDSQSSQCSREPLTEQPLRTSFHVYNLTTRRPIAIDNPLSARNYFTSSWVHWQLASFLLAPIPL